MTDILLPVIITAAVGLLAGALLAAAAKFLAVPVDQCEQAVRELLPGANCGGCGYSGCDGYAAAVAAGEAAPNLCAPGGAEIAKAIAAVTGTECGDTTPKIATVRCHGHTALLRGNYNGLNSCAAASTTFGGPLGCRSGCLGFGDCVAVCEHSAITVKDGVADIDPAMCGGCRKCVSACPRGIIDMVTIGSPTVMCRNANKGPATRAVCTDGCLGCGKCVRECPCGAISLQGGLAVIDSAICNRCGKCATVCPTKAISAPYSWSLV